MCSLPRCFLLFQPSSVFAVLRPIFLRPGDSISFHFCSISHRPSVAYGDVFRKPWHHVEHAANSENTPEHGHGRQLLLLIYDRFRVRVAFSLGECILSDVLSFPLSFNSSAHVSSISLSFARGLQPSNVDSSMAHSSYFFMDSRSHFILPIGACLGTL